MSSSAFSTSVYIASLNCLLTIPSKMSSGSPKVEGFTTIATNLIHFPTTKAITPRGQESTGASHHPNALIPSKKSSSLRPPRPKLLSHPSGSKHSHLHLHSKKHSLQSASEEHYQHMLRYEDDEDDGSMVIVRVPKTHVLATQYSNENLATSSNGQLTTKGAVALRLDHLHPDDHVAKLKAGRHCHGTRVTGLSLALKLESHLLLLRRELHLYQAFDESSEGT